MSKKIKSFVFLGNISNSKETQETKSNATCNKLGLTRCKKCGEYYGNVIDDGEELDVECICNGIVCRSCDVTKIHRPISNYFDETDSKIWHVPYFGYVCRECKGKKTT